MEILFSEIHFQNVCTERAHALTLPLWDGRDPADLVSSGIGDLIFTKAETKVTISHNAVKNLEKQDMIFYGKITLKNLLS